MVANYVYSSCFRSGVFSNTPQGSKAPILWHDIGSAVCALFRKVVSCVTYTILSFEDFVGLYENRFQFTVVTGGLEIFI